MHTKLINLLPERSVGVLHFGHGFEITLMVTLVASSHRASAALYNQSVLHKSTTKYLLIKVFTYLRIDGIMAGALLITRTAISYTISNMISLQAFLTEDILQIKSDYRSY